jgi:hypothetical protein
MTQAITVNDLTTLELEIINAIKHVDNPSYFFLSEILSADKEKNKILRGAVSSLVKKGVLDINTEDGGLVSVFADHLFPTDFFKPY